MTCSALIIEYLLVLFLCIILLRNGTNFVLMRDKYSYKTNSTTSAHVLFLVYYQQPPQRRKSTGPLLYIHRNLRNKFHDRCLNNLCCFISTFMLLLLFTHSPSFRPKHHNHLLYYSLTDMNPGWLLCVLPFSSSAPHSSWPLSFPIISSSHHPSHVSCVVIESLHKYPL